MTTSNKTTMEPRADAMPVQPTEARCDALLARLLARTSFAPVPGEGPVQLDASILEATPADQAAAASEGLLPTPSAGLPISRPTLTAYFLRALARFLDDDIDGDYVARIEDAHALYEETLHAAAGALTRAARPLDELWVTLARSFQAMSTETGRPRRAVTVVRVGIADLVRDESLFARFSALLPKSKHFDQNALFSVLSFYEPIRSTAVLERLGKLCRASRALAVVNFGSLAYDKIAAMFEPGGPLESLASNEPWKEHVMLVGSRLRVRQPSRLLTGDRGTYATLAPIIAAAMIGGDYAEGACIAQAQAGFRRPLAVPTADESDAELEFDVASTDLADRVRPLNLVVKLEGRIVPWGINTLSLDPLRSQAPVVRTEEWLAKCLQRALMQDVFVLEGGNAQRDAMRNRIEQFLRDNSDPDDQAKPFHGGQVVVRYSKANPRQYELDVRVRFKSTISKYVVRVLKFVATANESQDGYEIDHVGTEAA